MTFVFDSKNLLWKCGHRLPNGDLMRVRLRVVRPREQASAHNGEDFQLLDDCSNLLERI